VPLQPGDRVEAGQVILVAHNPKLDQEIAELRMQIRIQEMSINKNRVENLAQMDTDKQYLQTLQKKLDKALQDKARLTIRAPFAGEIIATRLDDLPGRYLRAGDEICTVATLDQLLVRAMVDQANGERLLMENNPEPEIRLAGDLLHTVKGRDPQVINAAQYEVPEPLTMNAGGPFPTDPREPTRSLVPLHEARIRLGRSAGENGVDYRLGQRAHVRFRLEDKKPLIWQWSIRFWQLINQQKQHKPL